MISNVAINHYRQGRLVDYREGHNTWVLTGHRLLSQLLAYTSMVPLIPEISARPKFIGFGIGGKLQTDPDAFIPPILNIYPVAQDPNASTGDDYDHLYPIHPNFPITTLERPVRIVGSSFPYPGIPADRWMVDATIASKALVTHEVDTPGSVTYTAIVDATAGEIIYPPCTKMPISEVGLFSSAASDLGVPYDLLLAYFNFPQLVIETDSVLEINWRVEF